MPLLTTQNLDEFRLEVDVCSGGHASLNRSRPLATAAVPPPLLAGRRLFRWCVELCSLLRLFWLVVQLGGKAGTRSE